MATIKEPAAEIAPLPNADGSVIFSYAGFKVIAAANGPVETLKREEYAYEALVDVIVRPAAGVGGTRERHLESVLQSALRQLIPIRNFPRCLIQVTLQIVEVPRNDYENGKTMQYNINLPIIPALLHAAILALLSGAIPLKGIATAALLVIPGESSDGKVVVDPTAAQIAHARSVHVLGFTSEDDLLLAESEGQFSLGEWEDVVTAARQVCLQSPDEMSIDDTEAASDYARSADMKHFIRTVMASKVAADLHWKISV